MRALFVLFAITIAERFGMYMLNSIIALHLGRGSIVPTLLVSAPFFSLLGGIAVWKIGVRRSLIGGGFLLAAGAALLAAKQEYGCAFVILGSLLFRPAIFSEIADADNIADTFRRFVVLMIAINLGATAAPLVAALLTLSATMTLSTAAFALAGCGAIFMFRRKHAERPPLTRSLAGRDPVKSVLLLWVAYYVWAAGLEVVYAYSASALVAGVITFLIFVAILTFSLFYATNFGITRVVSYAAVVAPLFAVITAVAPSPLDLAGRVVQQNLGSHLVWPFVLAATAVAVARRHHWPIFYGGLLTATSVAKRAESRWLAPLSDTFLLVWGLVAAVIGAGLLVRQLRELRSSVEPPKTSEIL